MESNKKLTIIIKKKKKSGGGGHHGGSWKVAYADFVTAMMAFFLLMWLLSSVPQEKKEEIAFYFKHFSLFEEGSGSRPQIGVNSLQSSSQLVLEPTPPSGPATDGTMQQAEDLKEQLEKEISAQLEKFKDQVVITVFKGGVKVDIMDKVGTPMFALGSTELTPDGHKLIALISEHIKETKYQVEIEGHTDAVTYSTRQYGNWELSTGRASAARLALEKSGLNPKNLVRVSGYADTQPVIKENPYDPRNRRISLRLYPEETKGTAAPIPAENPPAAN